MGSRRPKNPERPRKDPEKTQKKKEEKERSSFTITQQREKNMSKNMRNGTQNTAKVSHQTTRLQATHTGVSKASSLRATHTGGSNRQESSFAATHQDGSNRQESSLRATHTGGSNRQCNDGSNRHSLRATHTGGANRQESNLRVLPRLLILVALTQVSWAVNVNRILERLPVRASAQNVAEKVRSTEAGAEHVTIGAEHVTSGKGEKPVKLAPIEFTGVSMLKAKKSLSQNYEIRNIEYNPDNHVYGFKKIKNFNFKIMGIKNLKMCSKSGYLQVLLRLKRTNKKGETGYKTNTWMKGACNRWVLLDTSGIQFLRSAYFNDLEEGVHTSEKKSQFLCDFVTGNPILAGILGVIIDDPKTHFAALKLKKQGKTSRSYEVRNINVLGTRNGRNQVYMFVNSSQYKRANGNFHIGSPFIFNIVSIEAVTDDIKTGLCRVLLTFNRIGGGSGWGGCPRYLLLDREGIKFMTWLLIKQALEGHYILNEPSLVTKQREKIQLSTNKGRMAADHKSTKPLEDLVFDPRLQAVLLLVLDARKKLNADQAEKNRDIEQKQAAYKIIVEEQTAKLKKWESTVADACAMKNLDESIKKLLAPDIGNDISGLGWFQDLVAVEYRTRRQWSALDLASTGLTHQTRETIQAQKLKALGLTLPRRLPGKAWVTYHKKASRKRLEALAQKKRDRSEEVPMWIRKKLGEPLTREKGSPTKSESQSNLNHLVDGHCNVMQQKPAARHSIEPVAATKPSVRAGVLSNMQPTPTTCIKCNGTGKTGKFWISEDGIPTRGKSLSQCKTCGGTGTYTVKPAVESNIAWKCACGATKQSNEKPTVCGGLDGKLVNGGRAFYTRDGGEQEEVLLVDSIVVPPEEGLGNKLWTIAITSGKRKGQQFERVSQSSLAPMGKCPGQWSKTFDRLRRRLASRRRLENRPIHRLLREIRRAQA